MHAAFVADPIWRDKVEPARTTILLARVECGRRSFLAGFRSSGRVVAVFVLAWDVFFEAGVHALGLLLHQPAYS